MSFPLSGVPRILTAQTTASADDALAVLSPRDTLNAGELVAMVLRNRAEACYIAVDSFNRKLYATTDEDTRAALSACIPEDDARLVVVPESAGMLAKWNVVSQVNWEDVSTYFHATNRRSVLQIVNAFVRDDGGTFAAIDQNTSTVKLLRPFNAYAAGLALAAVAGQGFTVCYEFAGKNTTRLIFE